MRIEILADEAEVALRAAAIVTTQIKTKPQAVLGLPTGSTPLALYRELARSGLSFSQATTFNLDEYAGLPAGHPSSYRSYMEKNFLAHVDLPPQRCHLPDGQTQDLQAACARYEEQIRAAGGLDLTILGIGHDGHIAFNEPPSSLSSRTRVVRLASPTRKANAAHFGANETLPSHALTMGVGTILDSRRLLLLATGSSKSSILARAVEGPLCALVPASAIQLHPDVTVLCDEAAASDLQLRDYYRDAFGPSC